MAVNKHYTLSPLSTGYHNVAEAYVKHFFRLVGITIIPHGLSYLLYTSASVAFIAAAARVTNIMDVFSLGNINFDVSLVLVLLVFVIQLIGAIALIVMVTSHEQVAIHQAFEKSLHYVWRLLGVGGIVALAGGIGLLAGSLVMTVLGTVMGLFSIELLNSTFSILTGAVLTISTTLVSAFVVFAPLGVIAQNMPIKEAVHESISLVRQTYWPVLFRLALMYVLVFILSFVLQFIPALGTTVSAVVVSPFALMYLYDLYTDLLGRSSTSS